MLHMEPGLLVARPYVAADHSTVEELLAAPLGDLYPGGRAWLSQRLSELPAAGRVTVLGPAGAPVAVAIETWKPSGRVKLSTFYVAPQCRRRGAGRLLAQAVLTQWRREHRAEAYVTVASQHAQALSGLLIPYGFTTTAVEEHRYGPDRHEHVLAWVASRSHCKA